MKPHTLLLAILLSTGAAAALADDPKPKAKPDAAASAAASGSASAKAAAPKAATRSRAEVKAEAVEANKKHRTTLSESEDLFKK